MQHIQQRGRWPKPLTLTHLMKNDIRKYLLDKFQTFVLSDFDDYCQRHGLEPSALGLTTFLIDQDLIQKTVIQQYAVQKEFGRVFPGEAVTKTQAIGIISHRFNISERTVWNILRRGN